MKKPLERETKMLKRLRLQNFRKHEQLEIAFEDNSQLILINGKNGAGKSTILEAILYGLFGEGRYGKRNLDSLVRWGSEGEGLEVEIEIEIENSIYRVVRKRVNGFSTAVLYGNGNALTEGANEVTLSIEIILGMDSVGFKTSVIAQQNELDGLSGLSGKKKADTVSRLLRLDTVTSAKSNARNLYNNENSVFKGLQILDDIESSQELAKNYLDLEENSLLLADVDLKISDQTIEQEKLVEYKNIYEKEILIVQKNDWDIKKNYEDLAILESRLDSLRKDIPVLSEEYSEVDESNLLSSISELEKMIALSEDRNNLFDQREITERQIERIALERELLQENINKLEGEKDLQAGIIKNEQKLIEVTNHLNELHAEEKVLEESITTNNTLLTLEQSSYKKISKIGDICLSCNQAVDEVYKKTNRDIILKRVNELKNELAMEEKSLHKNKKQRVSEESLIEKISTELIDMKESLLLSKNYSDKLLEIQRREAIYKSQIERLPSSREPVEEFLVERTEKLSELASLRSRKLLNAEKERAEQEIQILEEDVNRKKECLTLLEIEKTRVAISQDTVRGFTRYNELSESISNLENLNIGYKSSIEILVSKIDFLKKGIEKTQKIKEYREMVKDKAMNASNASIILNQVENEIATRIVPSVEGTLTEILSVMSGGRFRDLKVSNEYDVSINEEGEYRSIAEFSGGEQDLVSLAMRLALANVIKEHNGGGVEFIILDECLGSQDHQRRETILNGLRNLKSIYKQIFLISHIPGIDDAVDRVIDVSSNESTVNEEQINKIQGGENG